MNPWLAMWYVGEQVKAIIYEPKMTNMRCATLRFVRPFNFNHCESQMIITIVGFLYCTLHVAPQIPKIG